MSEPQRRAVIDVGTNSVKLLVADVVGKVATPVTENSRQTRLGEGFYASHLLQTEPIARTAEAVKNFAKDATDLGTTWIRVFATSAARDAGNQSHLVDAIHQAAGLPLEIISGDQEAEWGYRGVISNPSFAGHRLLLLDVGGGSSQFIVGDRGHARFSRSFPLGCVRLLEKLRPSEHPTPEEQRHVHQHIKEYLLATVAPALKPLLMVEPKSIMVGTGGSATILARLEAGLEGFDRDQIEAVRLSHQAVLELKDKLWNLPLAERKKLPGLPANRADVILLGSAIYSVAMEVLELEELRVSTRGLRFGAVIE